MQEINEDRIIMDDEDIDAQRRVGINIEESDSDNYEIILLDVNKRIIEKIDIREIFDKQEINKYIDLGFRFEKNHIKDSEKFTRTYFKSKGYNVLRATSRRIEYENSFNKPLGEIKDFELELLKEEKIIKDYIKNSFNVELRDLIKKGVPDFLVYKKEDNNIKELFFVESKIMIDSLRFEQMVWLFSNSIPTKIMVV